jgi:hypothetical protein
MLKLFKSVIRPNEGAETYHRDSKHRVTMGYDADAKVIKVKVDEVRSPNPNLSEELPEDTATVLRDVHTTADYVLVAERGFTEADFLSRVDNNKWIVEYDSKTKTISDPIDVYEMSKKYINGSDSHEKIYYNLNEYRYQNDPTLTPCFVLDKFYKSLGFDGSTVQFFVEDLQVDLLDSILEIAEDQVTEVTPKEYEFWCSYNNRVSVAFEILDSDGKILSSAFTLIKPSEKSENFTPLVQKSPVNLAGISQALGVKPTGPVNGNRFYVQLPSQQQYAIRIMFGSRIHNFIQQRPFVTFDVECVNGLSSKNRITTEYDPENPKSFVEEFVTKHNIPAEIMENVFGGAEGLVVQTIGTTSGDFFKLKLNLGNFKSWAELWVEIV